MKCAAFVERHLADPGLAPAGVARAFGISLRYLQVTFQEQGTTPSAFILERRLARCRRDLADPALQAVPVHAIGARWGFPRSSEFSRAFRRREGVPPGGYRLLVRGSGTGEPGPDGRMGGGRGRGGAAGAGPVRTGGRRSPERGGCARSPERGSTGAALAGGSRPWVDRRE
ncbi:helix-turn-helix domain-containing protein [Streptomyces sp. NPDC002644]